MIVFDEVSISYPEAMRPALSGASFTIADGDLCLVMGRTGTGKSTLLGAINGLVPHFTGGQLSGRVTVAGLDTRSKRPRDLAEVVGFVAQNPLAGFVTDRVEDEVAYGMEQLGLSPRAMRKRVEETLDIMGIADLRRRALIDLSGGQQQRVAIAAVLAAQPRVVVLDEPTSALDPTAAQDVLASITTLVHEVGLTVVLAEHRLERVMHAADSVLWLAGDGAVVHGPADEVLARADVVPPLSEIARTLGWERVPLSVRDARRRVEREHIVLSASVPSAPPPLGFPSPARDISRAFGRIPSGELAGAAHGPGETVTHVAKLSVAYDGLTAVNEVSLELHAGEVTALMWALQGATPSSGVIDVAGVDPRRVSAARAREVVSLVPQNAADLLYLPSVGQECVQADRETDSPSGTTAAILSELGAELPPERHPRDLSEGQRLALVLAIQLAARPTLILLDEPTRGLDYAMKQQLRGIVQRLASGRDGQPGSAILVSTHDVEFAAQASSRTLVMADGDIVADGPTREVCTSSPVFAPQVSKVFHPTPLLTTADLALALGRPDGSGTPLLEARHG